MPQPPPPLPPLPPVATIDQVVDTIQTIIGWSIEASSRLGYFAALYKRITIAIRTAIAQGLFQDGPRMERFDVTFASRYFAALNGHFHPGQFPKPTHDWQVASLAAQAYFGWYYGFHLALVFALVIVAGARFRWPGFSPVPWRTRRR